METTIIHKYNIGDKHFILHKPEHRDNDIIQECIIKNIIFSNENIEYIISYDNDKNNFIVPEENICPTKEDLIKHELIKYKIKLTNMICL